MRKPALPEPDEVPDPLPAWKQRHPHERRLLALLETDWPGGEEIGRRFLRHSALSAADPEPLDVSNDDRLATALRYYRALVAEGRATDRERLWALLESLAGKPRAKAGTGRCRETWMIHWMPASLARALSNPDEDAA